MEAASQQSRLAFRLGVGLGYRGWGWVRAFKQHYQFTKKLPPIKQKRGGQKNYSPVGAPLGRPQFGRRQRARQRRQSRIAPLKVRLSLGHTHATSGCKTPTSRTKPEFLACFFALLCQLTTEPHRRQRHS